jgi:hypothetical protein
MPSFERLVFPEVAYGQAQGIDWDELVRHPVLEDKNEVAGEEVSFEFAVIRG